MNKNIIYYSDFGAKGDGITNDLEAIIATHEYANKNGIFVKADAKANYYIGKSEGKQAFIMTDTDWTDATFTIDDSEITPDMPDRTANIFVLKSDYQPKVFGKDSDIIKSINENGAYAKDAKNIGYEPGYPAMVIPCDEERNVFIRSGLVGHGTQKEVLLVDEKGNIDEKTGLIFAYEKVTKIYEYRCDDRPITIKGGTIITIANKAPSKYTYYSRGFTVSRHNVTIDGLTHLIQGELDHGAPYSGFIYMSYCNNFTVQNATLTAHRTYPDLNPERKVDSYMGTYDIGGAFANCITFKNCSQTNFFDEDGKPSHLLKYWGISGTNYCKNFTFDTCRLSRLDAHSGIYNATVINSDIIFFSLVGDGTAKIENSRVYNDTVIYLRDDYGSTWSGEVIIKDVTVICPDPSVCLFRGSWSNHFYGYKTYMPRNVVIDNLKLEQTEKAYIFNDLVRNAEDGDCTKDTVLVKMIPADKEKANGISSPRLTLNGEDGSVDLIPERKGAMPEYNTELDNAIPLIRVKNHNPMSLPESITLMNCDGVRIETSQSKWLSENVKVNIR